MHRHVTVVLLAGVWGAARTHTRRFATRETCLTARVTEQRPFGGRVQQESQGPIRPMNPGNAGGGKGPWFGVRSNEPREGDWREPGNS
jgi:hypothetical protein